MNIKNINVEITNARLKLLFFTINYLISINTIMLKKKNFFELIVRCRNKREKNRKLDKTRFRNKFHNIEILSSKNVEFIVVI